MTSARAPQANGDSLGRQVRGALLQSLRGLLSQEVEGIVVVRIDRVATRDLNELRASLKQIQASFVVVKNRLCRLIFKQRGWEALSAQLEGSCGIAPILKETPQTCKRLVQFAKDHEGFVLQGGMLESRVLTPQQLVSLARLPSRQVLLASVVGGIRVPLSGLVGVLSGVHRQLAAVLHAIFKQKEREG